MKRRVREFGGPTHQLLKRKGRSKAPLWPPPDAYQLHIRFCVLTPLLSSPLRESTPTSSGINSFLLLFGLFISCSLNLAIHAYLTLKLFLFIWYLDTDSVKHTLRYLYNNSVKIY